MLRELSGRVCGAIRRGTDAEPAYRWLGHGSTDFGELSRAELAEVRVHVMDGSTFSMPDTPELQQHFGQPSGQKPGCGFPVAHVIALFDARTGVWECDVVSPLNTGDVSQAAETHAAVGEGDVVLGLRRARLD